MHHTGDLRFLSDGSLVVGAGDGSQHIGVDSGNDFDECYDKKIGGLQGSFRSTRDEFPTARFIMCLENLYWRIVNLCWSKTMPSLPKVREIHFALLSTQSRTMCSLETLEKILVKKSMRLLIP